MEDHSDACLRPQLCRRLDQRLAKKVPVWKSFPVRKTACRCRHGFCLQFTPLKTLLGHVVDVRSHCHVRFFPVANQFQPSGGACLIRKSEIYAEGVTILSTY